MRVCDVMSREVAKISPAIGVAEAAEVMRKENVGALPVEESGKLVGILTDRDIALRAVAKRSYDRPVRELMTAKPFTIRPDATAEDALGMMIRNKVRRLVVVEDGHVAGMVSLQDFANGEHDPRLLKALQEFQRLTRHN